MAAGLYAVTFVVSYGYIEGDKRVEVAKGTAAKGNRPKPVAYDVHYPNK